MKQILENKIRDILVNAQATHDTKIKMVAEMCEEYINNAINETMYFVRTHHPPGSYPNRHVRIEVTKKLKEERNE